MPLMEQGSIEDPSDSDPHAVPSCPSLPIFPIDKGVKLNFVPVHVAEANVGSCLCMLSESGERYKVLYLKKQCDCSVPLQSAAGCQSEGVMAEKYASAYDIFQIDYCRLVVQRCMDLIGAAKPEKMRNKKYIPLCASISEGVYMENCKLVGVYKETCKGVFTENCKLVEKKRMNLIGAAQPENMRNKKCSPLCARISEGLFACIQA